MKDVLIGIDAGTSVIKSIAFDLQGNQIGSASVANEYILIDGGGAEQSLQQTWQKTASTIKELCEKITDLPARIAAISVTGQGDGTWLMDKQGNPAGDALLWLDGRAAKFATEISSRPEDQRRFELSGAGLAACQQGPQLLWLLENKAELMKSVATAFHCKDWVYYQLTGDIATDPSEGVFSFGNFRSRQYDDEVIQILGLDKHRHLMPKIVDGTTQVSKLSSETAKLLGLLPGTPVVLGYVDVVCTALGAGLYDSKETPGVSIVGSTGMHMRLVRNAQQINLNKEKTGYVMPMPIPGVYAQMQSNMAATMNIDWLLDLASDLLNKFGIKRSRSEILRELDSWVAEASPGAVLYQPYILEAGERGPFIDVNARAGFIGLSSLHGFEVLARSVFEGLCFAARDCYGQMGDLPKEVRLTGGGARSKELLTILGATLAVDVRTSEREEEGAAGAAMIAAVSIGIYPSMDDCIAEWVTPLLGELQHPEPQLSETYRTLFPAYQQSYRSLQPVWKSMADWRSNREKATSMSSQRKTK